MCERITAVVFQSGGVYGKAHGRVYACKRVRPIRHNALCSTAEIADTEVVAENSVLTDTHKPLGRGVGVQRRFVCRRRVIRPTPHIRSSRIVEIVDMGEYGWPGNVRELRNCMEYSVIVCKTDQIEREDLPQGISMLEKEEPVPEIEQDSSELRIMSDFFTKQRLEMAKKLMVEYKGNKSRVAKKMGVSRSTLYRILNAAENTQNEK